MKPGRKSTIDASGRAHGRPQTVRFFGYWYFRSMGG
jgi:hypothetical protein